ncbi:MAG: histidine phosphatase family protein [Actinobacteria bacterium]|nr:histidine phosphatase family protein [Actinomycetota bacterium]
MSAGHPRALTLIRHAQSAGNVANDAAIAANRAELDLAIRDVDVALSPLGESQAKELGSWFAGHAAPDVVLCSPYRRALATAQAALDAGGVDTPVRIDERLREREFGMLDRLTRVGIEARYPEQAAARAFLGKFFHRPPGGESWADVAARVRAVLVDLRLDWADADVVVITHQAVIMLFRLVLEELDELRLLEIDAANQIANTAVTRYEWTATGVRLAVFNDSSHLTPAETTDASDLPAAPR